MIYILEDFMLPEDAKTLIKFYDKNTHLCDDNREFHKSRNIHYDDIPDLKIKSLLKYYEHKNVFFIDHYFKVKTKAYSNLRLVRWKKNESMDLHQDRIPELNDMMDFSSLCYLNDNYQGGELFFETGESFKMKALSCVIFPSGKPYGHGINKVIKGKRYTIPSWYKLI
jgi:predicted 2-oxoglutarate/Fe(II)-dependent dioxygenase YbiX